MKKHLLNYAFCIVICALAVSIMASCTKQKEDIITRSDIQLESDVMTPEALWAMGRIGSYSVSPNGEKVAYQVSYYSVEQNRSNAVIYVRPVSCDSTATDEVMLGLGSDPVWLSDDKLAFASKGEVWTMDIKANGKGLKAKGRKQLTKTEGNVEGFLFSPDQKRIILIKQVPFHDIIQENPSDLPKATGRLVTDLMYRHWDHYVESIPHPFVLDLETGEEKDILEGQPFECPMEPFGGIEQLAWSTDSKQIAYTCRTKTGLAYSISTDSDIFLYNIESGEIQNLCKGDFDMKTLGDVNPTKTLANQTVNQAGKSGDLDLQVGYDQNPKFSPDGRYLAWTSMERDGYEADRLRLCIYDLKENTKTYVTESFDSNVDDYCWAPDSKTLYYIGVWHATENLYKTNLQGEVKQLTNDWADFGSLQMLNDKQLLMERHSYVAPADLYVVTPGDTIADTKLAQITEVNKEILDQLGKPSVEQYWVPTTDGKEMLTWVILPPHFDPSKKYPTLLFCEGGPQSPVSQFWSYRWNFFIMASQGYVIVAPNRRGLPGFGQEWLEEISGDWTGQCMQDYLSAIDFACDELPYVDRDRLGAVGASFGGFSVYYLAGHHEGRFKCFIAHDGAFNLEAMYTETEENWFSNWEYDDAPWNKDQTARAKKTYENSPHRFVDQWDTPILCIHGEKDYRINATQGMSAFNAARMRGIEAQLLIFPDENHWVLKPQNGVLWQRTYFNWLARWLK
ncbi:MAG: S9 family peptidase [Bacteroidaceae bacterium]|nr:S9 family peptidase [Bacteroidaceae bacterium]